MEVPSLYVLSLVYLSLYLATIHVLFYDNVDKLKCILMTHLTVIGRI